MDLEYDRKFEEMKKYIPFLESMIKRLESTSSGSANPRQAQLDKIRSLRDLLLDKKKRMKMENLLKCEQVLVNLYTKVEQRDTLPGIHPASEVMTPNAKSDLNSARNKLKTVAINSNDPDTLPEIARASETEVVCVPGSKEPALFQRRPNKSSLSPTKPSSSEKSPQKSSSKRNYTRVLLSPDRSTRTWSPSDGPASDQPLFSRRSPPRPSRRYSPSYHKRERKKPSKQESHSRKHKDLNITLKVPEESLNSLNTKDILSRIINCSDGDVDITTLRELRTQILGELKQTGANEDISDLILKSYKNKKRVNKKDDVEEGELSDSESEAIESIYGNLVVVEKDKGKDTSNHKKSSDLDQVPRKIQICLVINSDKEEDSSASSNKIGTEKQKACDINDFEMFDDEICNKSSQPPSSVKDKGVINKDTTSLKTKKLTSPLKANLNKSQEIITIQNIETETEEKVSKERKSGIIDMNNFDLQDNSNNSKSNEVSSVSKPDPVGFKANFYKPLVDLSEANDTSNSEKCLDEFADKQADHEVQITDKSEIEKQPLPKESEAEKDSDKVAKNTENLNKTSSIENVMTEPQKASPETMKKDKDPEIPLLNEPTIQPATKDVVSEIDILQALKNEILSETIALPCAEVSTPALHQPKITKVSNAQELPKKRISIENYKQKSARPSKTSLFVNDPSIALSKEESRKQSLKLTEKEVERFNLISKIALNDSSDEEEPYQTIKSPEDIDLAPKSPDVDITDDVSVSPPVIIPADPVKTAVVSSKADVDMRKMPTMSPNQSVPFAPATNVEPRKNVIPESRKPIKVDPKWPTPPVDPRVRRDNDALRPTPLIGFPNVTPSRTPSMTPSMTPNRTPVRVPNMSSNARSFEVTPSRPFDTDEVVRKHVYAPMFPTQDITGERTPVWEPPEPSPVHKPNWDVIIPDRDQTSARKWDDRDPRSSFAHRDDGPRSRCGDTKCDSSYNRSRNDRYSREDYSRQDCPRTPSYYGRSECPATPTPSFGRGDAPTTPSHYFGRSEGSMTPSHPFGRTEAPLTPSHPFGRSEAPLTPSHPFGRSEAPLTPSHPFGRSETPMTPSHPFGRSDYSYNNQSSKYGKTQDPRLNRSYDNDSNSGSDRGSYNDRYRYMRNDPRNLSREQNEGKYDKKPYTPEQTYNREQMSRREPSVGRSISKDYEKERLYSRDRNHGPENSRSYAEVGSRRDVQREPNIGRSMPDQRARASSVGRTCGNTTNNKLSVKSHAGRAFTIDTSVNSTFQKLFGSPRSNDSCFDIRRQRASSVGRSLTRESSVGRTLPSSSSNNPDYVSRNKFSRAQSVGRDLSRAQSVGRDLARSEKSFKDVRAEFESYRRNEYQFKNVNSLPSKTNNSISNRDPRRRESYDKQQEKSHDWTKRNVQETNPPIKKFNYRDPRQRKEQQRLQERFNDRSNRNRSDSRDRHSYGISSDIITKNPVINSVKNYKIPKIKRAPEEKPEVEVVPAKIEPNKDQVKPVEKDSKQKSVKVANKGDNIPKSEKKIVAHKSAKKDVRDDKIKVSTEKSEKRITRQSGRKSEANHSFNESDDEEIGVKTRKSKKIIYHSDSDESTNDSKETGNTASPKMVPVVKNNNESTLPTKDIENQVQNINGDKALEDNNEPVISNEAKELDENQETLDSSFGLDDIDLFSDNIITDPVLDNINALIADLDNDLDAPKGDSTCNDLFNEISIENMLEKITSSPAKPVTNKGSAENLITGAETVNKDLFDSLKERLTETNKPVTVAVAQNAETKETANTISFDKIVEKDSTENQADSLNTNHSQSKIDSKINNTNDPEAVVSTSVNEDETLSKDISADSGNLEGRSTPDSTNDAETVTNNSSHDLEGKPDSTVEKQCEMNSDISSTHDTIDKLVKESPEVNIEPPTQIDSIGSLLSILQDKTKIKELLNMLGGQSIENEKIKKKLAKLSEIVSDDEDTNDVKVEESGKSKASPEDKAEIKVDKNDNKQEAITDEHHAGSNIENLKVNEVEKLAEIGKTSHVDNIEDDKKVEKTETDFVNTNKSADNKEFSQLEESNDVQDKACSKPQNDDDLHLSSSSVKKMPGKLQKRFKTRKIKRGRGTRKVFSEAKRITRSEAAVLQVKPGPSKKPSRELKQLQESIKEMFMSDDILNASGIRMCRLAKMVDDKKSPQKDEMSSINESEPVVVLEKVKHVDEKDDSITEKSLRKKPGPKPKIKPAAPTPNEKKVIEEEKPIMKYKPGPKSKTRITQDENAADPYDFETDSLNGSKTSEKLLDNTSESENESLSSSKSYGSSELLVELKKKPKRKRKGWQAGVIKPKHKKRKVELKRAESLPRERTPEPERKISIPDHNCFTDKKYCFSKNVSNYSCRLCESTHSGADIVFHYKKHHPHSEIPLSRMSPETAKEAIDQCEEINFQAISKIPTEKYTCRFCYKEFAKKKASLEAFFWHVVSMHTGEYKQLCSECINVTRCPFNLDIPPPPKDIKGQLIGYICGKCNFTQISLENLKTHVIVRHNDEQTEVYTINFAVMTKKTIAGLVKRCSLDNQPRVTRSSRSNQSVTEASDDRSDVTESEPETARVENKSNAPLVEKAQNFSFKSKIHFETDDNASDISNTANTEESAVKLERDDEEDNQLDTDFDPPLNDLPITDDGVPAQASDKIQAASDDIMDYPHFKIRYTESGSKEYICCINGADNHYKTGLLISMKKHVQLKHSENWDGYCFVCKVIVTPQGQHRFSDCLLHFLDKHIDNFPVFEKVAEPLKPAEPLEPTPERTSTPKTYINVRPLSDLSNKPFETPVETSVEMPVTIPEALPVIENVVSLMPSTVEPPRSSPAYPVTRKEDEPPKEYKYEEAQAEIMSRKHRVVLDAMMAPEKLIQVFKCAGRFCSFTSNSAEDALLHASTHQRVGGTSALLCSYCDFDSSGNTIDLVSHVFKNHGRCQFACGLCFYRAAASQLVGAHIARVHKVTPGQGAVLKATNAPIACDSTEENLTREIAVPLYICKQNDGEETCSFRTVTHTKFWEHLTQKHAAATGFSCYICNEASSHATALVLHLKTHGLRLYHCTRCVFGADNEPELLAHASASHPAKPPQAYIRTICGMSGNGSFKILPLVELKKTALPSEEVATDKNKENPVREAERSIELEKLIGHLNVSDAPAESSAPAAGPEQSAAVPEIPHNITTELDDVTPDILGSPALSPMATLMPVPPLTPISVNIPPVPITPPPVADLELSKQMTPILKEEPKDTTPGMATSDVICLDSDEEDSKQGIISLSDDENPNASQPNTSSELVQLLTTKKIPNATVFKCESCTTVCSTIHGFKKHLFSCYAKGGVLKCAHCGYVGENIDVLLTHYSEAHGSPARYGCGICQRSETTLVAMKRHVKTHNVTKLVVTSTPGKFGEIHYVVGGRQGPGAKPGRATRRKSSAGAPAAPAKRRYGPSDIDKLPINPILDESVHCEMCEFHTKVRLNMVRHLQQHAEQQPVPQTAPVNPVPHLETNEMHFDKMVNLASSSAATRAPEKAGKEALPTVLVSAEAAARYPKFVPERHRLTCGARGCAYISLDEGMLRRHWETLHPGTGDYHCVHCPPYQHLDKSKPLTAARIIAHLKMHDVCLYACSLCPYYHYKRQVLDKHVAESHRGGRVVVVREEAAPAPAPPPPAPTMDLKPWQCGLCKFKSMLRAEVVEHCSKIHQSKMQYKCAYCPFRTSMPENVTKHQTSSHSNREPEIFYFYYREGSIPDAADGTPHWQKQRQKTGVDSSQEVKAEIADTMVHSMGTILPQIRPQASPVGVNLNLVKQEVDSDSNPVLESVEDLCKKFGEFCEPNGLNYKCSLCKVVVEDSKVAMQCHLFEELKYRKWGCRLCSYKAFHQTGLKEHMWTEHRQNQEPIELAVDVNVESWVSKQLDYQEELIKKNRDKLTQQKIQVERTVAPAASKTVEVSNYTASKLTNEELEKAFGPLGVSSNMMFVCPKCKLKIKDEVTMQDHLEAELTKIRWCCSNCPNNFTTYHEAQFHCKSTHAGQASRPVEASRDPAVRAAWVAAVLATQRHAINLPAAAPTQPANLQPDNNDSNDSEENSLLVIRYEEKVPTPEEETLRRKRPASTAPDSDDENLVIDEPQKRGKTTDCPHCVFTTKYNKIMTAHILRHYNLKPFSCPYCEFNSNKPGVLQHIVSQHSDKRAFANRTQKPLGPPTILDLSKQQKKVAIPVKKTGEDVICLTCEKIFSDFESKVHVHDKDVPKFGKKGEVVVKCCESLLLFPDVVSMQQHNTDLHPNTPINYAYYKLLHDTRDLVFCVHCNQRFSHLIDLKSHHNAVHSSLKLAYRTIPYVPGVTTGNTGSENTSNPKRKAEDTSTSLPSKRVAKKSTTKLPASQAVAKKSTSKLPFYVDSDSESEEEEYSFYGTKPKSWDNFVNVTTLMPFCNTVVPFTLKKLSEIIKIDPKVVVEDVKK